MPVPTVSVVMAVLNGMPVLREAVDSILAQTFTNFEFLVVDDGSTDGTASFLADAAERDPRVSILQNERNLGLTPSLNRALDHARGLYIARMDADDISLPERLALQVRYLEEHPQILLLGAGRIEFAGEPPGPEVIERSREASAADEAEALSFEALLERNAIVHSTVVFRRSLVEEGLRYREAFAQGQDYDLWLRIALRGGVARLARPLVLFRRSAGAVSLTKTHAQRRLAECARRLACERRESGSDRLEREGRLPHLDRATLRQVRRNTVRILFEQASGLYHDGARAGALRTWLRACWPRPDYALREAGARLLGRTGRTARNADC